MKKAEARIEEEAARSKKYLDSSTHDKLRKEVDQVLIERHKEELQVECEAMLRDDKQSGAPCKLARILLVRLSHGGGSRADLSRMYHLLLRVEDGIKPMLDVLQSYVESFGMDALKSLLRQDAARAQDPKSYVEVLLSIYQQFSDVVKKAFNNDTFFVAALDKVQTPNNLSMLSQRS